MKKLFSFVLSVIMVATLFPIATSAVEPYSLPTITSTICNTCGKTMQYAYTDDDYTSVTVSTCSNTPYATSPHKHNFHYIYYVYECEGCGLWGRKFISSAMQCEIAGNDYSLR